MQKIERVKLFRDSKEYLKFFTLSFLLFCLSLLYEYYNYTKLHEFDTYITDAVVLRQYTKTKADGSKRSYQVLKLKSDEGFSFYTIASRKTPNYRAKKITIEFYTDKINFLAYLKGFFAYGKILSEQTATPLRAEIAQKLEKIHLNSSIAALYKALFLALPMSNELQQRLSALGISHLLALSGFHLSVLFGILFYLFKHPYSYLQQNYFPYRNRQRDLFFLIAPLLALYLYFVGLPPSLLRAYAMLLVVFYLYDRGVALFSMQTLFIVTLLLVALFPKMLFSIGFLLSVSGVFYIFLFLELFVHLNKRWQFVLLPLWVYLMMLPFSLYLFGNFSLYHPLSIFLTALFSIFYPLSLLVHIIGLGDIFDGVLEFLLTLDTHVLKIDLSREWFYAHIALSLATLYKKELLLLLLFETLSAFVYAVYYVTEF